MIQTGMIVKSIAGHDKGSFYIAVKVDEKCAYICDGRIRMIEKPKKKNLNHLVKTNKIFDMAVIETNKEIKKRLWDYNFANKVS